MQTAVRQNRRMILQLSPAQAQQAIPQLVDLLIDAVGSGASIGFIAPIDEAAARTYWEGVIGAMREESRVLLVASDDGAIQGSVQLALARCPDAAVARGRCMVLYTKGREV